MLLATHSLLVDQILILAIAVILDLSFGEPPEKVHPVAWIGKSISFFDKRVKRGSQRKEKLLGIVIALFTIVLFSSPCVFLYLLRPYSRLVYIFVSACVFKTTFAIRALEKHARATITNDLERKRYEVSKIVSRDTGSLNEEQLNSASIESVAENVTDSIVSPIFYFAFFNVAGAMAFRVVNTLDAMIGYKTERYKNFGCFSARLDDVLNFLPARIAGLLICLSTNKSSRALSTLKAYRKVKLNSGWTLSAMSGALGVRLEKKGEYIIGAEYEKADEKHITKAIKIMRRCSWLFILISVFLITGLYFGGWQWFG